MMTINELMFKKEFYSAGSSICVSRSGGVGADPYVLT